MLLNKSKYKVFLAIFVYMSHNIFINIQRGFPPQHGDFHEHFIYDMEVTRIRIRCII